MKPGPKKGYKQSQEHIDKRKRFGPDHHNWQGDNISTKTGRGRAQRIYESGPCHRCGGANAERHHIDGDTKNNMPSNIALLCRKCHMQEDGRLEQFREIARSNHAKAIAARRAMPKPTHCPRGHEYVHFNKRGSGVCYSCLNEYKRNKRRLDKKSPGPITG